MWRYVAPAFENDFRTILFDHVGAGGSDLSAYDTAKYADLAGYADDIVEIGQALGLSKAVFVGHSVSAMIGMLASLKAPDMFESLVFVGPSPRYINEDGYIGGFTAPQIAELLDFLADNHLGWSAAMAPAIMANPDRPELGEELTNSFCRTDPEIAEAFARVTFMSDNRADLARITRSGCRWPDNRPRHSQHFRYMLALSNDNRHWLHVSLLIFTDGVSYGEC
jgi:sigma-B regulation protein RsbQ